MKVAVIPARGGSKRIPGKNIRAFCGRPMIAWSIEAAKASGCFDRVVVSTDDSAIAAVAKEWGAEAPFVRPAGLADDFATTAAVLAHAADWLLDSGMEVEAICCLYATAPFVTADDLGTGQRLLLESGCDYAVSVARFPFPIQRALRLTNLGRIEMVDKTFMLKRSQDLEESFHDAGQFYWGRIGSWVGRLPIFGPNTAPVILPRQRVQDIDTEEDWLVAEALFTAARSDR
jgi:N-acylneuraminate cytidylyltransferase